MNNNRKDNNTTNIYGKKYNQNSIKKQYKENSVTVVNDCLVYGRNPVKELLKSDRTVDKIYLVKGVRDGSVSFLAEMAIEKRIPLVEVEKGKLDTICAGGNHQSIAAVCAAKEYSSLDDIIEIAHSRNQKPLIVILDGVQDPHNLGAIIRTAECLGVHGIIIPKHRSATLNSVVSKTSAGALEYMAVCKVTNINSTIEKLKKEGFWIFGAEAGGQSCYEADFDVPCALVLGSEGKGISRLVKENCDHIISIPMYGRVNSFNVSAAAAIIISEAAKVHNN